LPLGTDVVTASYSGDANYNPVTSTLNVTVEQVPKLTASANPSTVNQVEYTAITVTVGGMQGMGVPTGSVSFAAPAGSFSWWSDTETLVNGTATSAAFSPGAYGPQTLQVSVSYSGDKTYGPASLNVPVTVTAGTTPPFTLSATSVAIAVPGATTGNTSTLTVTPATGFQGTVYLSCVLTSIPSGALYQYLPSCGIPASVNVSGSSAVTATIAVSSTAASSSAILSPSPTWPSPIVPDGLAASVGIVIAVFFLLGLSTQRRSWWRLASFLFILALIAGLASCGGSSVTGGGGGDVQSNPGTTPGNYAFTVNAALTANGVSQAQTTVTVTIQ